MNIEKVRKGEMDMKKKLLSVMMVAVLTVGAVTFAYAAEKDNTNKDSYNRMIDIMKENGFSDAAQAMENRDFDSMDDFMNNMTEEDYDQMINIMGNNGYKGMANMMKSIGREEMIQMHNSMGGARYCH